MSRTRRERGAAAVEMAIILPLLLLVIGGLVDFGRAYYLNVTATSAAREGARMVAMGYTTAQANARITAAMPTNMQFTTVLVACPNAAETGSATVTITNGAGANQFHWMVLNVMPSFFGGSVPLPTLSSKGSMRCNG